MAERLSLTMTGTGDGGEEDGDAWGDDAAESDSDKSDDAASCAIVDVCSRRECDGDGDDSAHSLSVEWTSSINFNSPNSDCIHMSPRAADVIAIYSASQLDSAMVVSLRTSQSMRHRPR